MGEVARVATPLNDVQLAAAIAKAHEDVYAGPPSPELHGCVWAQLCLEHARGAALWAHNYGNITCGKTYPGDFYTLKTDEQVKPGEWVPMTLRYRAHQSHRAGAAAYLEFMEAHYESALALFRRGKAYDAAHRLKELRYFTANVEPYARSMFSLYGEFHRRRLASERPSPIPEAHSVEVGASFFSDRTIQLLEDHHAGIGGIEAIDGIKVSER
jgi:hypothetical protein